MKAYKPGDKVKRVHSVTGSTLDPDKTYTVERARLHESYPSGPPNWYEITLEGVSGMWDGDNFEIVTTTTATITIGRNIKGTPMSEDDWKSFELITDRMIRRYGATILFAGIGSGTWEDTFEEVFAWVITIPAESVNGLKRGLQSIAEVYEQDAIGFIATTEETLIFAKDK